MTPPPPAASMAASMAASIAITYGDRVENHIGNATHGNILGGGGPKKSDLPLIAERISEAVKRLYPEHPPLKIEIHDLDEVAPERPPLGAAILVIRGTELHAPGDLEKMISLDWDTKYLNKMMKTVQTKHARRNLCFTDETIEPDYKNGQTRVYSFAKVPAEYVRTLRRIFTESLVIDGVPYKSTGNRALYAEGNYYHKDDAYIGWHADNERSVVMCHRIGRSMPLMFWFWTHVNDGTRTLNKPYIDPNGMSVGYTVHIGSGDIYVMTDAARGANAKKRMDHWRHAAGDPAMVMANSRKHNPEFEFPE